MAKDPATLWYWNDWNGGTMTLTRHQKGCYIDLLAAQFNSGPLSLEQIKTVLGTDQATWTVLRAKFKRERHLDGTEVFFNERLATEMEKRKQVSKRQSDIAKKRWGDSHGNATALPIIENENEVRDRGSGKGWNTKPGTEEMDLVLPDLKAGAVIELFGISKSKRITKQQVGKLWTVFKHQHFTGEKYYGSANETFKHFINWSKNQNVEEPGPQKMEPHTTYQKI